jgi:hypothetical protein
MSLLSLVMNTELKVKRAGLDEVGYPWYCLS